MACFSRGIRPMIGFINCLLNQLRRSCISCLIILAARIIRLWWRMATCPHAFVQDLAVLGVYVDYCCCFVITVLIYLSFSIYFHTFSTVLSILPTFSTFPSMLPCFLYCALYASYTSYFLYLALYTSYFIYLALYTSLLYLPCPLYFPAFSTFSSILPYFLYLFLYASLLSLPFPLCFPTFSTFSSMLPYFLYLFLYASLLSLPCPLCFPTSSSLPSIHPCFLYLALLFCFLLFFVSSTFSTFLFYLLPYFLFIFSFYSMLS